MIIWHVKSHALLYFSMTSKAIATLVYLQCPKTLMPKTQETSEEKYLKAHVGGQRTNFTSPLSLLNVPLMGESFYWRKKKQNKTKQKTPKCTLEIGATDVDIGYDSRVHKQINLTQKSSYSIEIIFVHFSKCEHLLTSDKNTDSRFS